MAEKLIFLYLTLFPLGQLIRIPVGNLVIHPADVMVGITSIYTLARIKKVPAVFKTFLSFIGVAALTLLVNLQFVNLMSVLYLVRLAGYGFFALFIWETFRKKKMDLINELLIIGFAISLFGLVQYFWQPDLTSLIEFGWDDHLYRLVGTFLDPAFTGILIVFASLLAYYKKRFGLFVFFVITIALTYSRASFLSFAAGLLFLTPSKERIKAGLVLVFSLTLLFFVLPKPAGHGVLLTRTHSILAKLENAKESVNVISKYPLLGVGFDSLCGVKKEMGLTVGLHSCSGLDNSLLFVWATTGIIGIIVFANLIVEVIRKTLQKKNGQIVMATFVALFVHTQFTNTLFYPWVMGWLAMLGSVIYRD